MPTKQEIRESLLECLWTFLPETIDDFPIGDATCPIRELGLASRDGIELSVLLEEQLGCTIDKHLNPLLDDHRKRPRNVGEIVDWLDKLFDKDGLFR